MRVYWFSTTKIVQIVMVFMLVFISVFYSYIEKDTSLSVFLVERRELPIYSVETNEKKIAISFDAAWGIEFTEDILRILRERDIKTTFFLVGFWIDAHPNMLKRIAAEGHEIGNHSTTHPNMATLNEEQIRIELNTTQAKIERLALDRAVKLFRPPFGAYNNRLIAVCNNLGFQVIQWDVDSLDWKEYGVEHLYSQVTKKLRSGSIVLFRNNAKYITQALPGILDNILERGYRIVPISELVYKDNYYIDHTGRQIKIEDAD